MGPPDVQTAVVITRLRVMKVDEFVDEWADLEVQQRPVPKPQKGQVGCTGSFLPSKAYSCQHLTQ